MPVAGSGVVSVIQSLNQSRGLCGGMRGMMPVGLKTGPMTPWLVHELRGRGLTAVQAALELPWTTSPAEGQINRLKMLKRTMYGRAGFRLLRARVLHPT